MTEIKSHDFRENLADILNRVMFNRESVTVTRHGKPVAILVPPAREVPIALRPEPKPGAGETAAP